MTNQCPMNCCTCNKPQVPPQTGNASSTQGRNVSSTQGRYMSYNDSSDTEECEYPTEIISKNKYPVSYNHTYIVPSNVSQSRYSKYEASDTEGITTDIPTSHHSEASKIPLGGISLWDKAAARIDYDPESRFLKKMKVQSSQLLQNEQDDVSDFENDTESYPYQYEKRPQIPSVRGEVAEYQVPNREGRGCPCRNHVDESQTYGTPCEPSNEVENSRKSQHVSRSRIPNRNRGRKKPKADAGKSVSQSSFQPTLKQPHEDSCERCWRYASPARSPVNKPEQKYDPNYRRSHSRVDLDRGDGDVHPPKDTFEVSDRKISPCQKCSCPQKKEIEQLPPKAVHMSPQPVSNPSRSPAVPSSPRSAIQEGLPNESLTFERQMTASRSSPQAYVNKSRSPHPPSSPTNQERSKTPSQSPERGRCVQVSAVKFSPQLVANKTRSPVQSPPPTHQERTRLRSPPPIHQEGTRVQSPSLPFDESMEISTVRCTRQNQSGSGNLLDASRDTDSHPAWRGMQHRTPESIRSKATSSYRLPPQSIPTTPAISSQRPRSPSPMLPNDEREFQFRSPNVQQQYYHSRPGVSPRGDSTRGTMYSDPGMKAGPKSFSPDSVIQRNTEDLKATYTSHHTKSREIAPESRDFFQSPSRVPVYAAEDSSTAESNFVKECSRPLSVIPEANTECSNVESMSRTPKKQESTPKVNRSKCPSPQKTPKLRKGTQKPSTKSFSKTPMKGTPRVSPSKFKSPCFSRSGSRYSPTPKNRSKYSPRPKDRTNLPSKIYSVRDDREPTMTSPMREEECGFKPKYTSTPKRRSKYTPRPRDRTNLPSKIYSVHDDREQTMREEECGFSPKHTSTPKRRAKYSPRPKNRANLPSKIYSVHDDRERTMREEECGFSPKHTSTPKRRTNYSPRPKDWANLPSGIYNVPDGRERTMTTPMKEEVSEWVPPKTSLPDQRPKYFPMSPREVEDEFMPFLSYTPTPQHRSKQSPVTPATREETKEWFTPKIASPDPRSKYFLMPPREEEDEFMPFLSYTPTPQHRSKQSPVTTPAGEEEREFMPMRGHTPTPKHRSKQSPVTTPAGEEEREFMPMRGHTPTPKHRSKQSPVTTPAGEEEREWFSPKTSSPEHRSIYSPVTTPPSEEECEFMPMHGHTPTPKHRSKQSPVTPSTREEGREWFPPKTSSPEHRSKYSPVSTPLNEEEDEFMPVQSHTPTPKHRSKQSPVTPSTREEAREWFSPKTSSPEHRSKYSPVTTPVSEEECEFNPMQNHTPTPKHRSKHSPRPEDRTNLPPAIHSVHDERPPTTNFPSMEVREHELNSPPRDSSGFDSTEYLSYNPTRDINTNFSAEVPRNSSDFESAENLSYNPTRDDNAQISAQVPRNSKRGCCICTCKNCLHHKSKDQRGTRLYSREDSNPETAGECPRMASKQRANQTYPCCGARKYVVYYMTQCKNNKGGDVEVLVEELSQASPNEEDSRTTKMEKKMKKILEKPTDSMALRFQKGVSESLKTPQASRVLYF